MSDWVLRTEESGYTRHFDATAFPVSIGADAGDDIVLADVRGSIQIGLLDGVFFVQPLRNSTNVRVDGEPVRGSRRLNDGNVIALDTARLGCELRDGRLKLAIEAQVTAGDTAPPDFDALARDKAGELTVDPIAYKPALAQAGAVKRRVSPAGIAVYSAFGILALLGWFAFTAKSVRFEIMPAFDAFSLPDTLFKLRLGDRYLLREGSHRVAAELQGYYPIDEVIDVGVLPDQTFEFEFVRLPGLVTFRTEPEAAAEISLNGEVIGTTPLVDFEVRPGTHQVQFVAERYLSEVATLDTEGGHERQTLAVALTPSWAPVTVTSEPPGAEIRVDGRALEVTPATLELTAGEREIELALAGYNGASREIRIFANQPLALDPFVLTLADGRVEIMTTPPDANVSLNGQYRGQTPVDFRLPPNVRHQLSVRRPGYEPITRELVIGPGGRERLAIDLEPLLGVVRVTSEPAGAAVLVGEREAGETPVELELMAIEQNVLVRLAGYAEARESITPRPGYPQTLSFDLEMLDAVTGDGYRGVVTTSLGQNLRLIPAGRFTMGSSRADPARGVDEVLRNVELSRAFYLAEKEMTNAEFRHCEPDHDSGSFEGHSLDDDDQPVANVTPQQIFACLNRLSIEDGLQPVYIEEGGQLVPDRPFKNGYRLPTEAEFAWALRGAALGETASPRFTWGEAWPPADRTENVADLSAEDILPTVNFIYRDGYPVSAPVGSFAPNAVGLYDIGGNVSEWVQDFYDPVPAASEEVLTDPLGPVTGRSRVVRGPSWRSATERRLRVAYRDYETVQRPDLGFRIARNLE